MRKVFITVLALATVLVATLFSATFAQTSQVNYYSGDSVPLFQGTLVYQEGFSYDSLVNYIISSDEAFYSAQYYGERTDSPHSIKLSVLDNYVVWQFDFVDQVICIDVQDATNAYALPVDGISYTYIIDDFSNDNVVSSSTNVAVNYANSGNSAVVASSGVESQETYNISGDGYNELYSGYATYEEYLAAYTVGTNQPDVATPTVVNSYSEVIYPTIPTASTISVQPVQASPTVVASVASLGTAAAAANTVSSGYNNDGFDDEGYDVEGYNRQGYDREGYNRQGYNMSGYDREGYSPEGYNMSGYDREGYNRQGVRQ